jgi:hypothetical protein
MILTPLLVIFIIIVFVPTFLFVRTIDNRKWLTLIISICLTPIIYFYAFYPMLNIFSSYHHEKYFDELGWKELPELRYEMLKNILDTNVFIGMSKNQIKDTLGSYEWLGWDYEANKEDINFWNYSIGVKPGAFNEHKEILSIYFKNNKVIRVTSSSEKIVYDN